MIEKCYQFHEMRFCEEINECEKLSSSLLLDVIITTLASYMRGGEITWKFCNYTFIIYLDYMFQQQLSKSFKCGLAPLQQFSMLIFLPSPAHNQHENEENEKTTMNEKIILILIFHFGFSMFLSLPTTRKQEVISSYHTTRIISTPLKKLWPNDINDSHCHNIQFNWCFRYVNFFMFFFIFKCLNSSFLPHHAYT